jgi:hypothetical protein
MNRISSARAILPMLALVLFALFLTSPELLHDHRSSGLGLYSAECPLAEVAARLGEASLSSVPLVVATWWAVGAATVAVLAEAPSPLVRSADPRAPPLA